MVRVKPPVQKSKSVFDVRSRGYNRRKKKISKKLVEDIINSVNTVMMRKTESMLS